MVEKGLGPELPVAGVNVEPAGALIAVMVSGVRSAWEPIVVVVKGTPTLAMNVPVPAQVGGGAATISSMRSIAVPLT